MKTLERAAWPFSIEGPGRYMTGAEIVEQSAGDGRLADATLVGTDENDSWFSHGTPWMRDADRNGPRHRWHGPKHRAAGTCAELAKALLESRQLPPSEILGGPLIGVDRAKVLTIVNFLYCCLEDTSHARWHYYLLAWMPGAAAAEAIDRWLPPPCRSANVMSALGQKRTPCYPLQQLIGGHEQARRHSPSVLALTAISNHIRPLWCVTLSWQGDLSEPNSLNSLMDCR